MDVGASTSIFMWQPALAIFLKDFLPVKTIEDSTNQYSTSQILRILQDHTGEPVDFNELYIALLEADCTYVRHNDELVWLFKRKLD